MRCPWRVWLLVVVSAACRAGAAAPPAEPLPTWSVVRHELRARWATVDELAVLVARLSYGVVTPAPGQPDLRPLQVASTYLRWSPDVTRSQQHTYYPPRELGRLPQDEVLEFAQEDFEHRYSATISRDSTIPVTNSFRVRNHITAPNADEGWVPAILGIGDDNYNDFSTRLSGQAEVAAWEEVSGYRCVRVVDGENTWWFAPELGYAPVCHRWESFGPHGNLRHESWWERYEPVDGAPELLAARGRINRTRRQRTETEPETWPEWYTQWLILYGVASVQVNEAVADPPWPDGVPLLVGGLFQNELTGLPRNLTTFGYSFDQLRRALHEDERPFGLEVPEIRAMRQPQAADRAAAPGP